MKADANAESANPDRAPQSLARQLRDIDAQRPDFPGEHLIVFGLGAWRLLPGMRRGTLLTRLAMTTVGSALIGRAASGTGGIARVARVLKKLH
ncbi:hypothetical protein G6F22_020134 [Rhizopus arrhizus]|nr:hypothetical protein G6F22_020134 [Rhizopus arrhizus]